MRRQKEGNQLQAKERGLKINQTYWHLDFGLSVPATGENKLLLLKSIRVYFVFTALAN
jgi:hypothetical protein